MSVGTRAQYASIAMGIIGASKQNRLWNVAIYTLYWCTIMESKTMRVAQRDLIAKDHFNFSSGVKVFC